MNVGWCVWWIGSVYCYWKFAGRRPLYATKLSTHTNPWLRFELIVFVCSIFIQNDDAAIRLLQTQKKQRINLLLESKLNVKSEFCGNQSCPSTSTPFTLSVGFVDNITSVRYTLVLRMLCSVLLFLFTISLVGDFSQSHNMVLSLILISILDNSCNA